MAAWTIFTAAKSACGTFSCATIPFTTTHKWADAEEQRDHDHVHEVEGDAEDAHRREGERVAEDKRRDDEEHRLEPSPEQEQDQRDQTDRVDQRLAKGIARRVGEGDHVEGRGEVEVDKLSPGRSTEVETLVVASVKRLAGVFGEE